MSRSIIRIYWSKRGAHIHCRVFTNGNNGTLVFDEREWNYIQHLLASIAQLQEEEPINQAGGQ